MSEYTPDAEDAELFFVLGATEFRVGYPEMTSSALHHGWRRWLAEHDKEVAAKAWEEGFEEPRECCGLCPNNSCPWDNGKDGPSNPYEQKGVKG